MCYGTDGIDAHACVDRKSDVDRAHRHYLCWRCAMALKRLPGGIGHGTFVRCPDAMTEADRVMLALEVSGG